MSKIVAGLIAILICGTAIFGVYWLGDFSNLFSTNLCYSEIISIIQKQVDLAVETGESEDLLKAKELLDKLPLHGYESNCDEIRDAARNL